MKKIKKISPRLYFSRFSYASTLLSLKPQAFFAKMSAIN